MPRSPARSCAVTSRPSRAHLVEITANAPETVASYLALARATLDRVVTDGRLLPIRAAKMAQILDAADPSRVERLAPRPSRSRSRWA